MKALIDGDLVAFRSAASAEKEEQFVALARARDLMERILSRVGADSFTVFLSGGDNFRKEIDPQYKANRKDQARPKWLDACREYLVAEYNAQVTDGIEADDALGIAQVYSERQVDKDWDVISGEETIICSLDKDLLQIPGKHYQWDISGVSASGRWEKPEQFYDITPEEGLKRFWTQMLVGDVADNITGVVGIGPKKAAKLLDPIIGDDLEELDQAYYDIVASLYNDPVRMHRNAKCLWVLRTPSGVWLTPQERMKRDEEEACRVD